MSKDFGNRLKQLRQSLGLSQSHCANHFGISTPAWLYWEKGSREPSISIIVEMCDFFNVSADELLGISKNDSCSGVADIAIEPDATLSANTSLQGEK